jgi:DNA-binding CsgD family transcriptional regulator
MIDLIYLIVYFLSYAAGFTALAVSLFAIIKGAPPLMNMYFVFLLSSVFFLLVRNLGYFVKIFLGVFSLEQSVAFYVIYMVSCGALNFSYINLAFELKAGKRTVPGIIISSLAAAVPLAFIPLLAMTMDSASSGASRLAFMNFMMIFTYETVVSGLAYLFICRWRLEDSFRKKLTDAILVNGFLYFLLGTLQWLTYRDENYSLKEFSIINVNLTLVFLSSACLIGGKYLIHDSPRKKGAPSAVFIPELTEVENKIIAGIKIGRKNKEIADELGLSLSRVKNMNYKLFTQFKVGSRTELLSSLCAYEIIRSQDEHNDSG